MGFVVFVVVSLKRQLYSFFLPFLTSNIIANKPIARKKEIVIINPKSLISFFQPMIGSGSKPRDIAVMQLQAIMERLFFISESIVYAYTSVNIR